MHLLDRESTVTSYRQDWFQVHFIYFLLVGVQQSDWSTSLLYIQNVDFGLNAGSTEIWRAGCSAYLVLRSVQELLRTYPVGGGSRTTDEAGHINTVSVICRYRYVLFCPAACALSVGDVRD